MKKTFRSFIILVLIVGLFGFSIYAHNSIEGDTSSTLREQVTDLQSRSASLGQRISEIKLGASQEKHNIYNTLLIMYPGEDDLERLEALFWPVEEEAEHAEDRPEDEVVEDDTETAEEEVGN